MDSFPKLIIDHIYPEHNNDVDNLSKIALDTKEDVLYIENLFNGLLSFKETIPFML